MVANAYALTLLGFWRELAASCRAFSGGADVALLAVARLAALAALSGVAYGVVTSKAPPPPPPPSRSNGDQGGDYAPLPSGADEEAGPPAAPAAATAPAEAPRALGGAASEAGARKRAKKLAKAGLDRAAAAAAACTGGDAAAARRKGALQLLAFLLSAACQVYLGVLAVSLPRVPGAEARRAALLIALAAAAHAENALAAAAVDAAAAARWAAAGGAAAGAASDASCPPLYTDKGPAPGRALGAGAYLRWSLSLAAPQAGYIAAGAAALLLACTAELAVPLAAGSALDAALSGDGAAFRAALVRAAALQVISGAASGARGLCNSTAAAELLAALSVRLYREMLRQDVAFFDAASSGDLLSRLTEDARAATEPANWLLSALARAALQAAGGAAMCVALSWRLTLLAGAAMGPAYALTSAYARAGRALQKARSEALGAAAAAAADALGNARLVRACGGEAHEAARFGAATGAARDLGLADARAYALTCALNDWMGLAAQLLLLGAGGHLVMRGALTAGALVAFQTYFGRIDASWQAALQFLQSLTAAAGSAERVLAVLELEPAIGCGLDDDVAAGGEPRSAAPPAHDGGEIEAATLPPGPVSVTFDRVCFAYALRPANRVLEQLSLEVRAGTTAAVVGASGGGKSTMIALCMRFYDPQEGTVRLGGTDLRAVPPAALRRAVALVAQDAPVFAASIEDNISYGLEAYTQDELREAASAANALSFITALDGGFATPVGERGVRLSGGQRQRVALARALLRRPSLLLLDEATSALDAASEAAVQAALDAALVAGRHTVLLVAHRLSTVRDAALIAVCAAGRIAEQGSHEQLLKSRDGIYARLVQRQLAGGAAISEAARSPQAAPKARQAAARGDEIEALLETNAAL